MVYQLFVQKESYLSLYFLLLFFGFRLRNFFHLQYLQIEIPLTLLRLAVQTDVTANIAYIMTFISLAQVSLINYLNHLISPFIFQHSMFLSSSPSNYLPFCLVVLLSFYFVILSLSKGLLPVFFPASQNLRK